MAAARITVSTVGVGDGADQNLLEEIARIGGGRYYFAEDPRTIPQIFAKETVAASKSAINEQPFLPQVVRPTQALAEIDFASAPFLLGYVVTRPKPTSEVILATESGDPLLAWWRYGLGDERGVHLRRQAALGRRVAPLAGLRQVLGAGRPPRDAQGRGRGASWSRSSRRTGHAVVTLDADRPGRPVHQRRRHRARPSSTRSSATRKLAMTQAAPGRYQAEFDTPHAGLVPPRVLPEARRQGALASSRAAWPSATPTSSGCGRPTPDLLQSLARRTPAAGSTRRPRPIFAARPRDRPPRHAALALPGRRGRAAVRRRRRPPPDRPGAAGELAAPKDFGSLRRRVERTISATR